MRKPILAAALALSCTSGTHVDPKPSLPPKAGPSTAAFEDAPPATERGDDIPGFAGDIRDAFDGRAQRRMHVQVDKPLYRPGETIWIRVWDLSSKRLSPKDPNSHHTYELVSPKGAVVLAKMVQAPTGLTTNDFEIPPDVPGGRYIVRATSMTGAKVERPVIVSSYEPPRIKKKLEFLRDAYGAGDTVQAVIDLERATTGAMAEHAVTAIVQLDGREHARLQLTTDAVGSVLVETDLPEPLDATDGLLTLLVEDAGVTESISRAIPLITTTVDVGLFPEGGQLVRGLPGRVYFAAKDPHGEPADVAGRVVDDRGHEVATFRSVHEGRGRFDLTPEPGRRYRVEITEPAGIADTFTVPDAQESGCVLRAYDDHDATVPELRVGVWCSEEQSVQVVGTLRDHLFDKATVVASPDRPGVAYLEDEDRLQGVARVTVFDLDKKPLAERLVFRNRGRDLKVELSTDRERYAPRDEVALTVTTKDPSGQPVAANVALSVVDDTVISFADDEHGHLLTRMYLEADVPLEVEDPSFYFDPEEEDAAVALDHLLGTEGYRRFDWVQLLNPPPPRPQIVRGAMFGGAVPEMAMVEGMAIGAEDGMVDAPPRAPADAAPEPEPEPVQQQALEAMGYLGDLDDEEMEEEPAELFMDALGEAKEEIDADWARARRQAKPMPMWAPVRVFPAPSYEPGYTGPRTDFRDTIHWLPSVEVPASGTATVRFHTSDALTSFRVLADGAGPDVVGHAEHVFTSSLPFGSTIKLPVAVSEGDRLELPVALANETDRQLSVQLDARLGELLALSGDASRTTSLGADDRTTVWLETEVTGRMGEVDVAITTAAGTLSDAFERTLTVTPLGFPLTWEASTELADRYTAEVDLGEAVPGTIQATVTLYPSPVSSMVQGMEALLREPSGCFEQTSSSNYPNVMVLTYLNEFGITDPNLLRRTTGLLQRGYDKLVSYESPEKGYEWFGGDPGHEALTAYGLLEFRDMSETWSGVDTGMVERTGNWLKSRRDGNGGYKRDPKALDSFGRAAPEVTDAYITWALSEAEVTGIDAELDKTAALAETSSDPYLLALAAKTLFNADRRDAALAATKKLVTKQADDGSFPGADHSITRSGGENLVIETTALAVLAMLDADTHGVAVQRAATWLTEHRGGYGQWGATQATVLALRAMTEVAKASRKTSSPGSVELWVNGDVAARADYAAGHQGALTFEGFGGMLKPGTNTVELRHTGEDPLPASIAVDYRSLRPATSPDATVALQTTLAKTEVPMGETVRLTATVTNTTTDGQPMTLARVGFPGGLAHQGWQLEEMRERGDVAFYETRPRELILYFRDLKPEEVKTLAFDLTAEIPGRTTGPASSAYLYYTDEHKSWTDGLTVTVTR
jgi:hypothetical protein